MKERYGENFYQGIGEKGGRAKHKNKGFGSMSSERLKEIATKGGKASVRHAAARRAGEIH